MELFHPGHQKVKIRVSTGCRSLKDTDAGIGAHTWRNRYIKKLQDDDARGDEYMPTLRLHKGIRKYMDEYVATGANYFVGAFQWGDLSHEQAMRAIELFTNEVMPYYS